MALDICGGNGVYLPENNCDDCGQLAERVAALEKLLEGMTRIEFSKTDTDSSISGVFLGEVNNG